jgi:MFS family permease
MTEPTTTITEDPSDTVTPPPSSTTTPSPPPEWKPTRNFYLAFTALCILCLAMAFDASVLSIALSTISADLGGTAIEAFWSVTSFLLASAVFQPTVAALSDIFGRAYVCFFLCLQIPLFG